MKRLFTTALIIILISFNGLAATITAVGNGSWTSNSTWDLNRQPDDGDFIVIPPGITVTVPDFVTVDLKGPGTTIVWIEETLVLGFLSGIDLNNGDGDRIEVRTGGALTTSFFSFIYFDGVATLLLFGTVNGPAVIQDGTLPIELASFEAKLEGNNVRISWTTAAEINNDFFTIERSVNGKDWEVLGEVPGAGNSNTENDYSFIDYDPVPGMSYYRLKQTDFDGQFEYFDPAVVRYEPDNLFRMFPNPATVKLQVTTSSDLTNAEIIVRSMNGAAQHIEAEITEHQAKVDVSTLTEGIYILEIAFPESVITKRFVKR